jgi:hypothetical protein
MPLRMDGCVEDDTGMRDGSPLNAAAVLSETMLSLATTF